MRVQKVNANNLNPMEMNNAMSAMSIMNLIQKIGKGKRKYVIPMDKNEKKFFGKFLEEGQKQFNSQDAQTKNIMEFFEYLRKGCGTKNLKELKVSYEEQEFLKKILWDSVNGMQGMTFKWWQFPQKMTLKLMLKQYKEILKKLNS